MKTRILVATAVSALALNGYSQDEPPAQNDPAPLVTEASPNTENVSPDEATSEKFTPYSGMIDLQSIDSSVYNLNNESVGNIDRFVADSSDGKVVYAVVSVGGFLGLGDKLVAVPWEDLQFKQTAKTEPAEDAEKVDKPEYDQEEENPAVEATEIAEADQLDESNQPAAETNDGYTKEVKTSKTEIRIFLDTTKEQLENAAAFDPENPEPFNSEETPVTES